MLDIIGNDQFPRTTSQLEPPVSRLMNMKNMEGFLLLPLTCIFGSLPYDRRQWQVLAKSHTCCLILQDIFYVSHKYIWTWQETRLHNRYVTPGKFFQPIWNWLQALVLCVEKQSISPYICTSAATVKMWKFIALPMAKQGSLIMLSNSNLVLIKKKKAHPSDRSILIGTIYPVQICIILRVTSRHKMSQLIVTIFSVRT